MSNAECSISISDDHGRTYHRPWTIQQIEAVTDVRCGSGAVDVSRSSPVGEWHHLALAVAAAFLLGWKLSAFIGRRARRP